MNALFGAAIKGFLTLMQAQDAVRQDHGDGADGGDGSWDIVAAHEGVRFM
ncbi:hypothetical protein [Accumulibacter sp.]|nr:hypothetical protein [Accumulibacter sp.]